MGALLRLLCVALGAATAHAANTHVRMILSHSVAKPGETVLAGIELRMAAGWHTYWRNPGESGGPTEIHWTLPDGVTAGEIQWPVPEKFEVGGITTYVYHDTAVLLVPLRLADTLPLGPLPFRAEVAWLECKELCLPGRAAVQALLTVGRESKPSSEAALLQAAQAKLPQSGPDLNAQARWAQPPSGNTRPLLIEWEVAPPPLAAEFFPYSSDAYEVAAATELVPTAPGRFALRKEVTRTGSAWPDRIAGVLTQKLQDRDHPAAYEVVLPVTAEAAGGPRLRLGRLIRMLGLAFLGGLILNVMPCVFPVIALKILGFVQQSKEEPGRVFRLGLIYTLGVLVSFLVLAALVIAVQQAGGAASWGMQMKNPQFTLLLTVLVTLVALNLFGVFEFQWGGRALNVAGALAARPGAAGAFFNGMLATALATPCTAPFLAPALGFAFTQPPPIIVLMFGAVALGLAAPYILLSWRPGWLRFLPKPGDWMVKFKVAMGFPMLATAIWLFWFTAKRFGPDGHLWLGLFLVGVALASWIWGEFVQRGARRRGLAMALALLVLGVGYGYLLEGELRWRAPQKRSTLPAAKTGVAWQKWSPAAVAQARAEGRPVLVDFTADWCLTCHYNKRIALEVPEVQAKLKALNAVALVANYTDEDPAIVAELKKFDRAGVPLVLVYPRDPKAAPLVLPTLLTKSIVLDALDQAAR